MARMETMRTVTVITLLKKEAPATFGRDKRPDVRRASERARCTTVRCPECDGKQEVLRSSELSEFSTGRACCESHEFRKERPGSSAVESLVVRAPAGRSLPGAFVIGGVYRRRPRPTPGTFSSLSTVRSSKQPAPINFEAITPSKQLPNPDLDYALSRRLAWFRHGLDFNLLSRTTRSSCSVTLFI
jgi:hypothetical protein